MLLQLYSRGNLATLEGTQTGRPEQGSVVWCSQLSQGLKQPMNYKKIEAEKLVGQI